ncbi:MAG: hypothetical protein ABW051_01615 [Burkholderiaceae bacterium]
MHPALEPLRHCRDITALRGALHRLCADAGTLTRLDILPSVQEGRQRAICLIRMETAQQESLLASRFGVGRFASDIVIVVDLLERWQESAAHSWSSGPPTPFNQVTDAKHPPHLGHTA